MTDSIFFDTDCISAFLWVNGQSLLPLLYPGRIVIPMQVYVELSNPTTPHLKNRVDFLIKSDSVKIKSISLNSEAYKLYYKLTVSPDQGKKVIGSGEAASIALAKEYNGIVASNNLRDIIQYVNEYNLKVLTTADILVEAFERKFITENQGNQIWNNMLSKLRKLGAATFSDYIKSNI